MERDNLAAKSEQELNPNGYGLYLRANPMEASGSTADEVTEYRQVLLECAESPLELQWAAAVASGLPIVTAVDSGSKSLHFIVRVDAGQDLELYKQRAKTAKACLEQYEGITVVNDVQDPIILTRFGGARRGDKRQDLLAVNLGARSWEEWEPKHKANAETKASVHSQEQQEDKPEPSYGKSKTYCPKQGGKLTIASRLDFDKINADLLSNYFEILQRWLPNGRKIGPDWCVGSLAGEPGQSLKIHIWEGFWIDFATGEKGGDPVSLYAAIHNLSQGEAAKQLSGYIAPPTSKRQPNERFAVVDDDGFKPVTNPPEDCIAAPVKGTAYYYHTKNGCVSFCIDRFEKPDGKKSFIPWTLWENCGGPTYEMEWRAKALTTPRPVYNLHKLTDKPSACVVVVEGEKCAEALQLILPEFVVTTWAGGANATGKTDFEPLRGRNLIFWPDNDDPGKKAMADLVALYGGKLVVIPDGKPEKWDCADAIAEGWGRNDILTFLGPTLAQQEPVLVSRTTTTTQAAKTEKGEAIQKVEVKEEFAQPVEVVEIPKGIDLKKDSRGNLSACVYNVKTLIENLNPWKDSIWFDTFLGQVMTPTGAWTDERTGELVLWVQGRFGITSASSSMVHDAVLAYARTNKRNCLQDWLNSLVWDGSPRLEHMMRIAFGTEPDEYHKRVGECWLISLVARALRPGCKVDTMPILEGSQGAGKSSALAILGSEWFGECHEDFGSKDFVLSLASKWIVEIAEMHAFKKADVDRLKGIITTATDRIRRPYGRETEAVPRQSVFVGTTNRDDWHCDDTGGRRFWPVRCGHINLEWLRNNREQLFAEAVARFKADEPWWEVPVQAAAEHIHNRRPADPWEVEVSKHLATRSEVSIEEILGSALNVDTHQQQPRDSKRVASILRALGWHNPLKKENGKTRRVWVKKEPLS
jgi:putative DNA primase/helicase